MATLGRTKPITDFLESLAAQDADDVDLIVVDQNHDRRVQGVIEPFKATTRIRVVKSAPGLSRARNVGISASDSEVIGFPDDDCRYPPRLVAAVRAWFAKHPDADGLSCRVTDERGRRSAGGYMAGRAQWITKRTVWRSVVSPGLFLRRRLVEAVGGFDEKLGVGAGTPWGSGEETEIVLRGLQRGWQVFYEPALVVHHPRRLLTFSRAWGYGRGMGFVLRRHRYPARSALYFGGLMWLSAINSLLHLHPGDALGRVVMGLGRWSGWWGARGHADVAARTAPGVAPLIAPMPGDRPT